MEPQEPPDLDVDFGSSRFANRELSWLDFNRRVLALAEDEHLPLLERAKFLAIFHQNLDEFFQVRVAGVLGQVVAGVRDRTADGLSPTEQLLAIRHRLGTILEDADAVWADQLVDDLADAGIRFVGWNELDGATQSSMTELFERRLFAALTPLTVDPAHPFPYISNLSLNLGVMVRDPGIGEVRFGRVKLPTLVPRFLACPDGVRFLPLEDLIAAHLSRLFVGLEIVHHFTFRVTRNADLELEEDEAEDLLAAVELEIRRRRFGNAVRLQVSDDAPPEGIELLCDELSLGAESVDQSAVPMDLGGLWGVYGIDRGELKFPDHPALTQRRLLGDEDVSLNVRSVIAAGDVLVHHPYDSFATSTEAFIRQAANDPSVAAIKMTLYRTAGGSPIVAALIKAAESGKQVVALVELKARFDEENNIEWARRLETAGVHVVYGVLGLKTHTKIALVVRNEADGGVRLYSHVGTGNYNHKTARIYEDYGLLTCNEEVGADLAELFHVLTSGSQHGRYRHLLVAPDHLRPRLSELIAGEIAAGPVAGSITMKMNSLVDPGLIDELYRASQAGIRVDLVIRGICCLRPGVPGLSETITVRSIVGRYLEHSRVYRFANGAGPGQPALYIGSADLMPRNLDRRVEAVVPILDDALRARIDRNLELTLADDVLSWELGADGWQRVDTKVGIETHLAIRDDCLERGSSERG